MDLQPGGGIKFVHPLIWTTHPTLAEIGLLDGDEVEVRGSGYRRIPLKTWGAPVSWKALGPWGNIWWWTLYHRKTGILLWQSKMRQEFNLINEDVLNLRVQIVMTGGAIATPIEEFQRTLQLPEPKEENVVCIASGRIVEI